MISVTASLKSLAKVSIQLKAASRIIITCHQSPILTNHIPE